MWRHAVGLHGSAMCEGVSDSYATTPMIATPMTMPAIHRVEKGTKAASIMLAPWLALQRRRARRAGLLTPDAVFGLVWSGAFTRDRMIGPGTSCRRARRNLYASGGENRS